MVSDKRLAARKDTYFDEDRSIDTSQLESPERDGLS